MLACLGHHAVVGRHHEKHDVDAGGAGHHLPHEPLVPRHVHHAHRAAARQCKLRETELDGDAAPLLLAQPVGIGAGERVHQRRLTMVDMPGSAENERRHRLSLPRDRKKR